MIIGHLEIADDVHFRRYHGDQEPKAPGAIHEHLPLEAHEDWLQNAAPTETPRQAFRNAFRNWKKFLDKNLNKQTKRIE